MQGVAGLLTRKSRINTDQRFHHVLLMIVNLSGKAQDHMVNRDQKSTDQNPFVVQTLLCNSDLSSNSEICSGICWGHFGVLGLKATTPVLQTEKLDPNAETPGSGSKAEDVSAKGYLFFMVIAFRPWYSMHGGTYLSWRQKKTKTNLHWEVKERQMIPAVSESLMYISIFSLSGHDRL